MVRSSLKSLGTKLTLSTALAGSVASIGGCGYIFLGAATAALLDNAEATRSSARAIQNTNGPRGPLWTDAVPSKDRIYTRFHHDNGIGYYDGVLENRREGIQFISSDGDMWASIPWRSVSGIYAKDNTFMTDDHLIVSAGRNYTFKFPNQSNMAVLQQAINAKKTAAGY